MKDVDYSFRLVREYKGDLIFVSTESIVGYLRKLALENPKELDTIKFIAEVFEDVKFKGDQ